MIAGAIAAVPFTGGASLVATGGALAGTGISAVAATAIVAGTTLAAGAIVGGTMMSADGKHGKVVDGNGFERDLIGSKQMNQWDYKETITSTFEWETLKCEKCTRSQKCTKYKNPLFGSRYCGAWGEPVNTCNTTQF